MEESQQETWQVVGKAKRNVTDFNLCGWRLIVGLLAKDKKNVVGGVSKYDAEYLRHFTGIKDVKCVIRNFFSKECH